MGWTTFTGARGTRGIYLNKGAKLDLDHVYASEFDVRYEQPGAIIYANDSNIITIKSSKLYNSHGFYWGAMAITNGELVMIDTDIHDNQSDSNSGGVKLVGSTAYITNGRIYDNIARKEGGGIALWDSTIILNGKLKKNKYPA